MKHLKLYEEYTDSTMEAGSTQTTGKTTIKPPATGAKPKEQFIREVNFYSGRDQKRVARNGWINLQELDADFLEYDGVHSELGNGREFVVRGFFYRSKMDAFKRSKPIHLHWCFGKGDLGDNGGSLWNFTLFVFEPGNDFIYGWNQKLNLFLRDRYLQKNSSGVWVKKVESGGFADNSSVDAPDKFA